jgi:hypothetical protein
LIKDLVGILNSFALSKNELISIKATELFSLIKDKILNEIFNYEQENKKLKEIFTNTNNNKNEFNINNTKAKESLTKSLDKNIKKESLLANNLINSIEINKNDIFRKHSINDSNLNMKSTSINSNVSNDDVKGCSQIVHFRTCLEVTNLKKN